MLLRGTIETPQLGNVLMRKCLQKKAETPQKPGLFPLYFEAFPWQYFPGG